MADKIVAEYDVRVDKALKDLDKLSKRVDKIDKDGQKSAKNVEQSYSGMSASLNKAFKSLGATIAAAFAVERIISFGKEAIKLSAQAEGVERAFRRIGSPQILEGLRRATRGTVSDLELMKNAVRASNFKIPLENLASLFKFAQARARETGESVDYLVDSIILGIGRKSPLILDNLGISAVELRKRLRGVGVEAADVGEIAQIIGDIATEELEKMGEQADTTADKMAQFSTSTDNLQKAIGKLLSEQSTPFIEFLTNVSTALEKDITAIDRLRQELTGDSGLTLLARQTEEIAKLKELEREATEAAGKVSDAEFIKLNEKVKRQREVIQAIEDELDKRADVNRETEITVEMINKEIAAYKDRNKEVNQTVITINSLNEELKTLQNDLKDAEIGSTEFFSIIDKVEKKTRELADAIAMTKLADALKIDSEDEFAIPDLSNVQAGVDEEVKIRQDGSDRIQQINDNMLKAALEAWEQFNRDRKKDTELTDQEIGQIIATTFSTIAGISSAVSQVIQNNYQEELNALENKLQTEQITREQYEQERAALERKAAEKEKNARLFSAILNTAAAITAALNTQPFLPLGPIAAAIAAASGAAQIAAIASQPLPAFAQGGKVAEHGLLKGKSHRQGGILIEAEGEEYFMPKDKTRKHYGLLEAIRQGAEEQYILRNYVPKMIDESMFSGFADMSKSAQLNGITAELKDHNILHGLDRLRQSQQQGFHYLAKELKSKNQKRGGYRA